MAVSTRCGICENTGCGKHKSTECGRCESIDVRIMDVGALDMGDVEHRT